MYWVLYLTISILILEINLICKIQVMFYRLTKCIIAHYTYIDLLNYWNIMPSCFEKDWSFLSYCFSNYHFIVNIYIVVASKMWYSLCKQLNIHFLFNNVFCHHYMCRPDQCQDIVSQYYGELCYSMQSANFLTL